MSDRRGDEGRGRSALALGLIVLGLMMLSGNSLFGLMLLVGGLLFLGALLNQGDWSAWPRQIQEQLSAWFDQAQTEGRSEPRQRSPERARARIAERQRAGQDPFAPEAPATRRSSATPGGRATGQMHRLAVQAVQRAGLDPRNLAVTPVELGVLVYGEEDVPTLYRESKLPPDAGYVRPFVVLRSPRRARGKIRFELVDGQGTRRFIDETPWELKEGETFVYPSTWLPTHKIEDFDGDWKLRVFAAGTLLAVHELTWRDPGGGEFRRYLNGDGEISDDLVQELRQVHMDRLSLDDLLEDQDGVIEFDPEVEAAAKRNERLNRQNTTRRR